MADERTRMQILEMIEQGSISAGEGLRLLEAMQGGGEPALEPSVDFDEPARIALEDDEIPDPLGSESLEEPESQEFAFVDENKVEVLSGTTGLPPDARKWKGWWMIPLWIGVAITVSGGFLMYQAQLTSGIGFWFVCAGVPFTLGVLLMALAWQTRTAPWLHLRVQQPPGEHPQRIAFSFPLPVRPAIWFFRAFGSRAPHMNNVDLEDILQAVGEKTSPENPIYIQVDEDNGEKVEIYIG